MAQIVEDWYKQMPVITRSYLTLSVLTTVGCALDVRMFMLLVVITILLSILLGSFTRICMYLQSGLLRIDWHFCKNLCVLCVLWAFLQEFMLQVISPYHIYLNSEKVIQHFQYWRLFTNFFYFGKLDLDFLFHMFFLARYCKLLEETSFRGRTADFFYMLLFGGSILTGVVLLGGMIELVSESLARILCLSNSLTFMMVYVWSKRNPHVHMSFLGLFTFTAPYLPWVLLGFSIIVGSSPWVDLLGMLAGHAYYFLEDVYSIMTRRRILKTPRFIKALFREETVTVPRPGNRWGAGVDAVGADIGQDVQRAL